MRRSSPHRLLQRLAFAVAVVALAACNRIEGHHGRRKPVYNWKPAEVQTVAGVPAAAIDSAIQQRLAGKAPKEVSEARWKHVQRLYSAYGQRALWMESEGPNKARTNALLTAVANADSDALRLDAYPLPELVQTVTQVRQSKTPSAQELADADVMFTTAYIALSEDLLSGQTNPKAVTKDWFIGTGGEQLDSAVALSLRSDSLADGIALMRPQDEDYAALQKELVRFRDRFRHPD